MKYQTLIRTTATLYLLMAVLGCTSKESKEGFLHVDKKMISVAKTATESRFTVSSTQHWQLGKPNTGAEWITNIAADNGTSNASSITGENDAFITITTTANPSNAERSTKLTLRTIDQTGKPLTYPTPVTISFTQLGTTHTGDVSVTTQAQVDALRTSLTAGATRIVGNVTIGPKEGKGTSDISDLSPFAAITEITGNVVVQRNPDLPNLMGLNQLQSIGGSFEVEGGYGDGNGTLPSLGDFPVLQTIGGRFGVSYNATLTSLGDFPVLQTIGGSFSVESNASLTSLGDFSALQSIGGRFDVRYNAALISLGVFPMLANIGSADEVYVLSTDDDYGGGEQDDVSIVVERNNRLQDCCVLTAFFSSATNAVSGQVFINNNDPGCNSTTEVNCEPFLQVGQKVVFVAKTATESTLNLFSRQHWQLNKPNTGAEWITNIAAGGGNSDASSITGENHAFITITTTANPNDAGRSTTLTLRTIDQAGNALTDPPPVTIPFTQLGITHTGDITLASQADINAFPANVTAIQGGLIIGGDDITDLRPLSGITHVTGRVEVSSNDRLVSLDPLGNLQSIGGDFDVSSNNALTSLGDFPALQSIGGVFDVSSNDALTSLGDFPALQSIGGGFVVRYNAPLTFLGAFPMLTSIGISDGVFVFGSGQDGISNVSIVVERNDRLQDCCVLTTFLSGGTNAVSGQVFIYDNAPGCNSNTEVNDDSFLKVGKKVVFVAKTAGEGTFDLFSRQHWQLSKPNTGAEWITSIAASGSNSNASSITGENDAFITITTTANPNDAGRSTTLTLRVIDMAGNALTDTAPITILFTQLGTTHTGDITLASQASVNAFPANVTAIQGNLIIGNHNSNITDLGPLSGITHVTGSVEVVRNDRLVGLSPLGNLQSIGGSFEVIANAALTSLRDFSALQSIGGGFVVGGYDDDGNAALTSLGDFTALQSIGSDFVVRNNDVLTSLGDFSSLQSIGGSFRVGGFLLEVRDQFDAGNASLTSLGDFTTLQSIGGSFEVIANGVLTSLRGFPMLASIGTGWIYVPTDDGYGDYRDDGVSIVVIENDRLQDCCVLKAFLSGGTNAVSGKVIINKNATGCNSEAKIKPCAGGGTKGK